MRDQSIKSQVYESILKDILEGVYKVNTVINEKTLVEKYNVSKTPVREALVQLCSEGILKNIPRFGYQLAVITPEEIREIIEYRNVIEVAALEIAFSKITEENIQELKELNKEAEGIVYSHNTKIHWDMNQEFHRKLCSFSNNRYLQKALESALITYTRISNQYFTRLWSEGKQSDAVGHKQIVQALEEKDLERARLLLEDDVKAFRVDIM